ncbi:MAG: hypothetical protein JSV52_07820 [Candidatus Zixiibacteriota bacterium]|nr:MAG: hypothetical protein JSV52_07820 [candidate division Zixibacteria bacterium]
MKHTLIIFAVAAGLLGTACSEDDEITGDNGNVVADRTIRVPQEQPTIQAGINAARIGDTVLVADGVYFGFGNQDIVFGGKTLVVKSENGPASTILELESDPNNLNFAFELTLTSESGVTIDGFTIRRAYNSQGSCLNLRSVSPTIKNCVFAYNNAVTSGGAVRCKSASPTFESCTFAYNSAPTGAAVYLIAGSSPHFSNCILAYSLGGETIVCGDAYCLPTFSCCDIYGNEGGDWTDDIAGFLGTDGNVSLDPMFCDDSRYNFHLMPESPCLAANSDCDVDMGALGADCSQ